MKDIFDRLAEENSDDIFSELGAENDAVSKINSFSENDGDEEKEQKTINDLNRKLEELKNSFQKKRNEKEKRTNDLKEFVRSEISKIKPVQKVIERQVEQVVKHVQVPVQLPPPPPPKIIERPPQIIREVRVEVPAKGNEKEKIAQLEKRLAELERELRETRQIADSPLVIPSGPGGSGVIGVPVPSGNQGKFLVSNGNQPIWSTYVQTIGITMDGGGSVIATGSKGYISVPYACQITNWTILADQAGSIVVDVKQCTLPNFPTTTSLVGSGNSPTLSSAQSDSQAVSGWTIINLNAGDIIEFNVSSASTLTRINLILTINRL